MIAVTGAGGHLGANVVRRLLADGRQVVAIDRAPGPALVGLDLDVRIIDVRDREALTELYRGMDAVIHLAAKISVAGDPDGSVWSTNVDGARSSAMAALHAGVDRYVHVSSIHALSAPLAGSTIDETSPPSPRRSPAYDRSKAEGERAVMAAVGQGLPAVVLRPTGIIGPHDYQPSRMGALLAGLRTGSLKAVTSGRFDWVDVRDVTDSVVSALDRGDHGDSFLLPGHYASFSELAELVVETTGSAARIREVPIGLLRPVGPLATLATRRRPGMPMPTTEAMKVIREAKPVSGELAAAVLLHRPRPLAETVADTIRWQAEYAEEARR